MNNLAKTYTLRALEPVKLAYGAGINRKLWTKAGADLGFTANNEVCLAVSGDNLVIDQENHACEIQCIQPLYRGLHQRTCTTRSQQRTFQVINDTADHIMACSWAPKNSKFILYRYNDVNDAAPVKLVEWTNNNPNAITGDGGVGRRVNVYGDLTKDAVIMAPAINQLLSTNGVS